jgi:hypothetical protein
MQRLVRHLKSNVVAYVALFFALGAGGGYAVAATTASPSIHSCVVSRTGELLVRARCRRGERALALGKPVPIGDQPTVAVGQVNSEGVVVDESGLVIKEIEPGEFRVTATAPGCRGSKVIQTPIVSPVVDAGPGTPVVLTSSPVPGNPSFEVGAGLTSNGGDAPGNQGFELLDTCTR